jgi:MoaA/NifB/PqqE/SkfB family radical SAM enzyme
MSSLEQFSLYNSLITNHQSADNPLRDLLPVDGGRGWHVARNLLKPLNHLDFLREKEEIAVELGLHSLLTPSALFDAHYALLAEHQARRISTSAVIRRLTSQFRLTGAGLTEANIKRKLRVYATVRHMEFHPSDVCNLTCRGCTYGHDDPACKPPPISFPFGAIPRIARLQPRSMVIIGGGEPTLYRSGERSFQEMVEEVCSTNPGIVLALVTNGTHRPPGDWPNRFSWIRVSLDAATARTYASFRGKPMFDRVMENYLRYLDYDVQYVGIGFLFAQSNIHEYAAVARLIFDLVQESKPKALHKVNIQYRPLRRDPHLYDKPFTEAISTAQIREVVRQVRELADTSDEMKTFLRDQTNVTAILGGNTHPPHEFSRCYYSQTFRIVRANGDLRPCFVRVTEPDFALGDIISDSLETIALNTLYIAARRKPHCDSHGCCQCHVNYAFEQGIMGNLQPSTSPETRADPMF